MAVIHSQYPEAGRVQIDEGACRLCGECAAICPTNVLRMHDGRVRICDSPLECIACGHCMMVCPEQSIAVTGRGVSAEDLLPLPPMEARATADALTALLHGRRSVRRFTAQELDPALLDRIMLMASSAPMGIPPWDVGCIIVRGRDKVQQLAADILERYAGFLKLFKPWVLAAMRPFVRRTTYEQFRSFIRPLAEMYVAGRREGTDLLFYGAPAVLIFHHSPYADTCDAAIACTYAMLAAESLGLGATMIGAAAPILVRNPGLCRKWGVPIGHTPAIALIVGHPAVHFKRAIRRHFARVQTFS
ncbi:MAG TPA: nitroreductase family protein [Candidatus Baltobacteraceae bacterium]|nr:nitroreductase family protein [Candidatus Baltobacteraceae bacterium]